MSNRKIVIPAQVWAALLVAGVEVVKEFFSLLKEVCKRRKTPVYLQMSQEDYDNSPWVQLIDEIMEEIYYDGEFLVLYARRRDRR